MHELLAIDTDAGTRLDRFVAAHCPELSRSRVQELIDGGLLLVNGKPAKPSQKLRGGELITVQAHPRPAPRAEVGRGQALSRAGDPLRPGIVHRLDKETSGVILVAKNDAAHARLGEAFRQRAIAKTYIALVQGVLGEESGRIELAIGRDPIHRTRMTTERKSWHGAAVANPREARTDWKALAKIDGTTLVEVQLHTGRTHQIRVHFSALKHSVVGDTLYGAARDLCVEKAALPPLGRNFLHAAKLGFTHPRTGAWIEVRAMLPPELRDYLKKLCDAAGEPQSRIDAALAGYL